VQSPTGCTAKTPIGASCGLRDARSVAVQVEFEIKVLNNQDITLQVLGYVETRRFEAQGQLHTTCTAPPKAAVEVAGVQHHREL
jgi:hypothetical protein